MNDFHYWKSRYDKGYATNDHIRRLVVISVLSADDYEEITGEAYEE